MKVIRLLRGLAPLGLLAYALSGCPEHDCTIPRAEYMVTAEVEASSCSDIDEDEVAAPSTLTLDGTEGGFVDDPSCTSAMPRRSKNGCHVVVHQDCKVAQASSVVGGVREQSWNIAHPGELFGTERRTYQYVDGRSCEITLNYEARATQSTSGSATAGSDGILTVSIRLSVSAGLGTITQTQSPVVLFKDGTACLDSSILTGEQSPAEHRAQHPGSWTTWSESNGKLKLASGTALSDRFGPSAKGLRLTDTYTRMGGGADSATSTVIVTQNSYQFFADGRFVQGRFAGIGSPGVAATAVPPNQMGTYEIDGYRLTLRYVSGEIAVKSFVAQKPPVQIMWIAGATFLSSSL